MKKKILYTGIVLAVLVVAFIIYVQLSKATPLEKYLSTFDQESSALTPFGSIPESYLGKSEYKPGFFESIFTPDKCNKFRNCLMSIPVPDNKIVEDVIDKQRIFYNIKNTADFSHDFGPVTGLIKFDDDTEAYISFEKVKKISSKKIIMNFDSLCLCDNPTLHEQDSILKFKVIKSVLFAEKIIETVVSKSKLKPSADAGKNTTSTEVNEESSSDLFGERKIFAKQFYDADLHVNNYVTPKLNVNGNYTNDKLSIHVAEYDPNENAFKVIITTSASSTKPQTRWLRHAQRLPYVPKQDIGISIRGIIDNTGTPALIMHITYFSLFI